MVRHAGALRPEQQDVARPELEIGERRRARGRQQDDTLPADLRPYAKGVPLGVPPDVGAHRIIHARALERRVAERKTARSEEHTSELTSLMRLSYAVFCLQKKKTNIDTM